MVLQGPKSTKNDSVDHKNIIYYFDQLDSVSWPCDQALFSNLLSQQRSKKIQKFKKQSNQKESAIAYVLLRLAVYETTGYKAILEFDEASQKKPHLNFELGLQFNLSHCKECVVCGLSKEDIGVDVQEFVPYTPEYQNILTLDELEYIRHTSTSDVAFSRIWTLKESYGKALGCGICYNLNQVSMIDKNQFVKELNGYQLTSFIMNNYIVSVCSKGMSILKEVTCEELKQFCSMQN